MADSAAVVDSRYGSRRYGDRAEPAKPPERPLGEDTKEKDELVITEERALGSGFRLATDLDVAEGRADFAYDFVPGNRGRMQTVSGTDCFGRDLAVSLAALAQDMRGRGLSPEQLSDLKRKIARRVRRDQRTQRLISYSAEPHPTAADTVVIKIKLVAETGELHEDVILAPLN